MRTTIALLLLCLTVSVRAREWKSELFHCTANVPDSGGWQIIESPQTPGIAVVLAMQHQVKQAIFGINIVEKYRDANLANPAVQKDLEAMLRQLGYQFTGHSNVRIGGLDWLLYPVRAGSGAQQVTGVIRFASAGGYVFSITLLRGGGQDAAQDAELQQAAASFRVLPAGTVASAAAPAPMRKANTAAPAAPAPAIPIKDKSADKPSLEAEGQDSGDNSNLRLIWYGVGGLFVLAMFFGIIGIGRSQKR